ncbi:hypothetical protein NO2_0803 [Candidatus Termititenax persephonae]|uniref:Uncharacterized protein n=1 Tax=Candidatus Termititenax persephonae TaxID=2218525 RepID=A0A388TH95_9BACT|nr:hypothetical protein NO2_0803 [Candidatus Termititenax persephonae]
MADISIYSKLSADELKKLHAQLTTKYGTTLQDDTRSLEERKLINLVNKKNREDKRAEELLAVREFVKEYLYRELKELALIIYLSMDKNKDFGLMGEQRVSISFCRNILNIPNNREVTQFDADRFRRVLDECDKRHGNKSGNDYLLYIKNSYALEIFGKNYPYGEFVTIGNLLDLLDVDYYLFYTHARPHGLRYIFGLTERVDTTKACIIKQEYVRSPQFVLSIAAEVFQDTTMIRHEACEVIFFNKWQRFFDQSKAERKRALHHVNSAIREGIKEKALCLYAAATTTEIIKIKDSFIAEMLDGILWHELGHHISFQDMTPQHNAFTANFTNGETVGTVLQEALADWAPQRGDSRGAFTRFWEIAQADTRQATRDIYVYMSDNWFVDEEEEFMGLMSNVLVGLAIYFVKPDGSVDFARLGKEKDQIYGFLQKRYTALMEKVLQVIHHSLYEIGIHKADYKTLEKEVFKMYQKSRSARPLEELYLFPPFWINILAYLKMFSPDGWRQYQNVLQDEALVLEQMILKVITKGAEEKYQNSIRTYIVERAKEIGIIKLLPAVDSQKAVNAACAAMKMPEAVQEKVQARVDEILGGKNYEISISYEGEKDPFIAALQEMMLRSGYGEIKSGMLLGEYYNPDAPIETRKQYIRGELESLRDQLESEMYQEIDILRVNDKYPVRPMVEELLTTITFLDGRKLSEKIRSVEFTPFNNDALLEAFVPLKRGYLDWNTAQAVWRINQDLRPDNFMLQWTVDRDFLEALIEAYS